MGASFDAPADNLAFHQKFDFNFDLLSDTDKSVAIAYGAAADTDVGHPARITIIIDGDGKVAKVYDKVVAVDNPGEVLADLG